MTFLGPMLPESFGRFGLLVEPPDEAGRTARHSLPVNLREQAVPTLTLLRLSCSEQSRRIERLERHCHSGQAFVHMGGGGLLVVVVAGTPKDKPDLSAVSVFTTSPGQCFAYHPGIWHAGVSALDDHALVASLLCCDGSPEDVEEFTLAAPLSIVAP